MSTPTSAEQSRYLNYTYVNEDDIPDNLKCNICLEPLIDPRVTAECNHYFCGSCLENWLKQNGKNKTCPKCRTVIKSKPKRIEDADIPIYLATLTMKCDACSYTLPRSEVEEHDMNCVGICSSSYEEVFTTIENVVKEWFDNLNDLIPELLSLADTLDVHHRNVKIAHISGTSASLVGTALVVGGFVGSFFTFGLSLGLSIAGGAMGIAGAATSAGASVTEWGIIRSELKKIQNKLNADAKLRDKISYWVAHLEHSHELDIERLHQRITSIIDGDSTLLSVVKSIDNEFSADGTHKYDASDAIATAQLVSKTGSISSQFAKIGGNTLIRTATHVSRAVTIAGVVLSVATVPLDIYVLVQDSKDVHTEKKSDKSTEIRELARHLKARRDVLLNRQGLGNESFEIL
ncbi:hypothetical protein AKO1_014529 [Acrasis kona]|uniref:RING-type domain-containing protein n=1 Tax=Acrasis kona TaxID=1008807 RepID=A0AAW2Z227_9EUKA